MIMSILIIISLKSSINQKTAELEEKLNKSHIERVYQYALRAVDEAELSKFAHLLNSRVQQSKSVKTNQKSETMKKPSIGRMVIYHTTEEQRNEAHRTGTPQKDLSAIVVGVDYSDEIPAIEAVPAVEANEAEGIEGKPAVEAVPAIPAKGLVNLQVFNDGSAAGNLFVSGCTEGSGEGQWSWPSFETSK